MTRMNAAAISMISLASVFSGLTLPGCEHRPENRDAPNGNTWRAPPNIPVLEFEDPDWRHSTTLGCRPEGVLFEEAIEIPEHRTATITVLVSPDYGPQGTSAWFEMSEFQPGGQMQIWGDHMVLSTNCSPYRTWNGNEGHWNNWRGIECSWDILLLIRNDGFCVTVPAITDFEPDSDPQRQTFYGEIPPGRYEGYFLDWRYIEMGVDG